MELFYSNNMENGICTLNEEESRHCSKVLRHVPGDTINIIDGYGSLYTCRIIECGKQVVCSVEQVQENFGAHRYHLTMAVCPTKNIDRYEWFLEKATEMGIDVVVPVIGEHSERRIIKPERLEKILVSAAKQSLKGAVPVLRETVPVKEFIRNAASPVAFMGAENACETFRFSSKTVTIWRYARPPQTSSSRTPPRNAVQDKILIKPTSPVFFT